MSGGHLECLDVSATGREPSVVECRAPGRKTPDPLDVRDQGRVHRVPLLTGHHERRVFPGWFHCRRDAGGDASGG